MGCNAMEIIRDPLFSDENGAVAFNQKALSKNIGRNILHSNENTGGIIMINMKSPRAEPIPRKLTIIGVMAVPRTTFNRTNHLHEDLDF